MELPPFPEESPNQRRNGEYASLSSSQGWMFRHLLPYSVLIGTTWVVLLGFLFVNGSLPFGHGSQWNAVVGVTLGAMFGGFHYVGLRRRRARLIAVR